MKIPILSDVHVHAWREFSVTDPDGVPSRLKHTLAPFDLLKKLHDEHDVSFVTGDVFHKRNVIHTQAFNRAFDKVRAFGSKYLHLIPGNHDQTTKDGKLHSLEPMSSVASVLDEPTLTQIGDTTFFFLPFIDDAEEIKTILKTTKRPKHAKRFILLGHLGVNGAASGPYEYKPLEQVSVTDFPSDFDAVLLGHYHTQQVLQKPGKNKPLIMYVGAPIQHSREDEGDQRGVLLFDTDDLSYEKVPVPGVPSFVTVKASDPSWKGIKGNFVTVELDADLAQKQVALLDGNAAGWVTRKVLAAPSSAPRTSVTPTMSHEQILKEYLQVNPGGDIDEDELLAEGLKLLAEEL